MDEPSDKDKPAIIKYHWFTLVSTPVYIGLGIAALVWIFQDAAPTLLVLVGTAGIAFEITCMAWHVMVDPTRIELGDESVQAVWRSGRRQSWRPDELRWRRARVFHASFVGMREFLDHDGNVAFRIWPMMIGSRRLFDAVKRQAE